MYLKINNPQYASARAGIIFALVVFFIYGLIGIIGTEFCGSFTAFLSTVWHSFVELWHKEHFNSLLLAFVVLIAPVISVIAFFEYQKMRRKIEESTFIRALDFQPEDVILISANPTPLAYADTSFKLTVHIKRVQQGKNQTVPKITQLTFLLTHKSAPEPAVTVEHAAGLEAIFPLLDYARLCHQFTYDFSLQDDWKDLKDYRTFVEEQIQTHLQFGHHLPYSKKQVRGMWLVLVLMGALVLMQLFPVILWGHRSDWFAFIVPLISVLIFGSILFFCSIRPLYRYYKAKKALARFGKK